MMAIITAVNKVDLAAFKWCMSRKSAPQVASISRWVSSLGDGYLYVLIGAVLYWLSTETSMSMFKTTLVAFAIELPAYLVFKNSIKRNRPSEVIVGFEAFLAPSDKFSFPSGHTAAAFLMATMIAIFYPPFMMFAIVLASLIGISRVLLGVHFPTDILAGIALGVGSALLAINIA